MGRVLKHNVSVRKSLVSPVYTFRAGEELPDEFLDLVGEHLFQEEQAEPNFKRVKKTGLPSVPTKKEEPKELEVPGRNASKPTWQKFLTEAKVDFPEDASRDDLVEIAEKALPDLEI